MRLFRINKAKLLGVFNKRLQYKITLLVWGVLIVFGLIGSGTVLYLERQATVAHFKESTTTLAAALADTIKRDMLLGDRSHIQESVSQMAARSPITGVTVVSSDQRIYVSAGPETVTDVRNNPEIVRALSSTNATDQAQSRYTARNLFVAFPVENMPACHTCHGDQSKILGAIEIARDTTPLGAQSREQTLIMAAMAGLTFVSVSTVLGLMLRSAVVKPLAKVADSAGRIARGDMTARVKVSREDEVGTLANSFNDMAENLEQHAIALQERTAQLQQMAGMRGQLLDQVISAQEEERRRLARELHDEVGQALSSIMLDLARAIDGLPPDAVEAQERLAHSRAIAAQTLGELRKLIYDLRPEVLDQLGLIPAIRSYAKSHFESGNTKVTFSFQGLKGRLQQRTETTVFRVIREAITNVIRHADASVVKIQIVVKDKLITASVEDNGRGFDPEAGFSKSGSWGLRGIRERAVTVGGRLSIESESGEGTLVKFEIPLEDEQYG